MGIPYIIEKVGSFFKKLDDIEKKLEGFSQDIDNRREDIQHVLATIPSVLHSYDHSKKKVSTSVEQALDNAMEGFNNSIKNWNAELQSHLKGEEFMKKHEKYLVVLVFGAVKAGKSSLGNFFAGKYFKSAKSHIDTEYNRRPVPVFTTEESGREKGGLLKEADGTEWFQEGLTDTTGAIQYFTLSGLRWMDSPGTGAIRLDEDTLNMEELVNEYISYADLCIFLLNSSEPGLQEDMKYMEKLSREGQESLVVITRSDVTEEDIDENDELVQVLLPKSPDRRKIQEDDIIKRLSEQYPDLDSEKFRAISISTLLARHAIDELNDEKFKESNLDKLMEILGDKASNQTIELKTNRPKKKLNAFIDRLICNDDTDKMFNDLETLLETFSTSQKAIDEYKIRIDERTQRVTNRILQNIQSELKNKLFDLNKRVEETKETINAKQINAEINKIIEHGINVGINHEISNIIEGYSTNNKQMLSKLVSVGDLGKNYETVEHTYKERELVERDPDGWWETAKSWIGTRYYETRTVTRTEVLTIDIGTNVNEVLESLLVQSKSIISAEVHKSLIDIKTTYFMPQEKYIETVMNAIKSAISQLKALKYEE